MQKGHLIEEVSGTRKALIISVSDYSTNLQPLDFCKNDGEEMYKLLDSLGYEILDNHKLVGQVKFDIMRDAIYHFFDNTHNKADDTLLFYYSGHGVPDTDGDVYLATSEVDPDFPYRRGFSFNELTRMMNRSVSTRIVSILDCCYSGAAKISKGLDKGGEEAAATLGTAAINEKSTNLQKDKGICLLAASQAAQEAYALKEGDHSIFTYYLLEGLKGNEKSVDGSGKVTADTLGKYVHREIVNLPQEKRPKQTPIRKVEVGDEIVLAYYPRLAERPVVDISTIILEGYKSVNNEDYSKAIELFDEAVKINPKSYVAHSYKGYALLKLKKYDEAIKCYDEALEINPKEMDALQNKGLALSNLSKYNEAIKCYDAVLEIDPINSKVWYYKGLALSQLSKYKEAIKCYDEAIKINPEYSDALRDKGLALEKLAREVVIEEPTSPPRADISMILDEGMQYFEYGDYDNAIKSFDKAIEINPKNPISYNYKGDVFFKLKKYEEAIKSYDEALEINPKYLDVLKDKGLSLDNLGKYQEAIKCFDAALHINPKIARNWYYKALSLSKLPDNEEAIRCYDEALRLEPNNIDAWIGRGVCLGLLKRYDEAIKCFDEALKINPKHAEALNNKGLALASIGKHSKAIECFNQSIDLNPNDAVIWNYKGLSFDALTKYGDAITCFDKAIMLNNTYTEALHNKEVSSTNLKKQQQQIPERGGAPIGGNFGRSTENIHLTTGEYSGDIKPRTGAELEGRDYSYTYRHDERSNFGKWFLILGGVIGFVILMAVISISSTNYQPTPPPETAPAPPQNYVKQLVDKGISLYNLGRYNQSIDYYDKALAIDPNNDTALVNKGNSFFGLARYDQAIEYYDKALAINPSNDVARKNKDLALENLFTLSRPSSIPR